MNSGGMNLGRIVALLVVVAIFGTSCSASVATSETIEAAAVTPTASTTTPAPLPTEQPTLEAPSPVPIEAPTPLTSSQFEVEQVYRSGAEVLLDERRDLFAGRRVGLIANQASQINGRSVIDVFAAEPDVDLVALFAPEHGVRGDLGAGELVPGGVDAATGVQVHSLYGANRAPTPAQLAEIDVLFYDLQDAGTRYYTFISTMGLAMQAAAAADVDFVVLDRPNPQIGRSSSGFVLDPEYASFIGQYEIPAAYALTPGEIARAIKGDAWLPGVAELDLSVVELSGWRYGTGWAGTGDDWIAPSPGLASAESVLIYPALVLFEATEMGVGRCAGQPFTMISAPWLDAEGVVADLASRQLPGVAFAVTAEQCDEGAAAPAVQLQVVDADRFDAVAAGVHIMAAVMASRGSSEPVIVRGEFLDLLAGTDRLRIELEAGTEPTAIAELWRNEAAAFDQAMSQWWLYEREPR